MYQFLKFCTLNLFDLMLMMFIAFDFDHLAIYLMGHFIECLLDSVFGIFSLLLYLCLYIYALTFLYHINSNYHWKVVILKDSKWLLVKNKKKYYWTVEINKRSDRHSRNIANNN
jgi:ABC-type multidrug transport system fused ATPase/permease subunit